MKTPLKSVTWLLPLVLVGCTHKTQQQTQNQPLAPPVVDTPPPPPQTVSSELPPPVVTVPQQTQPPVQTPVPPQKAEQKPPKHSAHHPKQTTEQAASSAPEVSAIGQLTPGDSPDQRSQTARAIDSIDRNLKAITRPLSDQEQKTAAQVREFLKQARTALASGDVDGAHTLAVKAKVLLDELNH